MRVLWIEMRRFAVSLMLAAVASLVLHGSAAAQFQRPGSGERCGAGALQAQMHHPAKHDHAQAAHGHDGSMSHALAAGSSDPLPAKLAAGAAGADQPPNGVDAPCCGSPCALALATLVADGISAPAGIAATLIPESQRGAGIGPEGPKRPPRPHALA